MRRRKFVPREDINPLVHPVPNSPLKPLIQTPQTQQIPSLSAPDEKDLLKNTVPKDNSQTLDNKPNIAENNDKQNEIISQNSEISNNNGSSNQLAINETLQNVSKPKPKFTFQNVPTSQNDVNIFENHQVETGDTDHPQAVSENTSKPKPKFTLLNVPASNNREENTNSSNNDANITQISNENNSSVPTNEEKTNRKFSFFNLPNTDINSENNQPNDIKNENEPQTNTNKPKPKFTFLNLPNKPIEQEQTEQSNIEQPEVTKDHLEPITEEKKKEIAEILNHDKPLGFGIFRTFQYLQNTSQLIIHKGENERILEYRDEFGNLVDEKGAFRTQSHVFHGRRPGAKKMKKLKEKSLAKKRIEDSMVGDTPLQSGKALREALANSDKPFIELTGTNRQIIPYIPAEVQVDPKMEKRKKRLKKVKKMKVKEVGGKTVHNFKSIINPQ
ncbi:hypothetical protein TVAG_091900 [Trichomonas vaginalis G3]|uniref:Uncharacterized protein n=1 Tax=Trichomonas vaginalis (strain ATCC PRA-98 / G3) TaxID=412133 RepID=A2FN55_TRIV3|nr:SART-1 family [Trichomonas vaginalis G3]EAX93655.1 hypothetical protein TVAG_091900 [Trichomonas vaginalis G3]KAI5522847.1 SART-1 family [Trichomonas vaginalis G3]|eukprot:XP_001306585.1 hypothetical protein [Trichomonas vaginalis G3]